MTYCKTEHCVHTGRPIEISFTSTFMKTGRIAVGPIIHKIDDYDLAEFTEVAKAFGQDRFGFVVTPNVDHLIRCYDDPEFRSHYGAAAYVLMDSRFASRLLRVFRGVKLPVCTGSDLTAALFSRVIMPADRVVLIGGTSKQAAIIADRYALRDLHHYNPPMGFIADTAAVDECLAFIEQHSPFRFCFLAVGSPQQESLAHKLQRRGKARGLALCIGASLNFLTGIERRAPLWVQQAGLEWLYRLLQDPKRLARRYVLRGPRFFLQLFRCEFQLRGRPGNTN
jgi:exopolysaccharide biosynthesis WecB/TagA/CpsF family protein